LERPSLYKIGLKNLNFSTLRFWSWIGYGVLQALMVYEIGFMCSLYHHTSANETGKMWGFWQAGQNVFWICIVVANFTLLKLHSNWTGWGEFVMFFCVACYWPMVYIESLFTIFPSVYKFFPESNRDAMGWFGALFCIGSLMTIDKCMEVIVKYCTNDEDYWQYIFPSKKVAAKVDRLTKEQDMVNPNEHLKVSSNSINDYRTHSDGPGYTELDQAPVARTSTKGGHRGFSFEAPDKRESIVALGRPSLEEKKESI